MSTYREMPRNVRRFFWLLLASTAVSFVYIPFASAVPGISRTVTIIAETIVFVVVSSVFLLLIWLVAWRRLNWARWALLILFFAAIAYDATFPISFYREHPFLLPISGLSTVLEAAGLCFLFTGDANGWFAQPVRSP